MLLKKGIPSQISADAHHRLRKSCAGRFGMLFYGWPRLVTVAACQPCHDSPHSRVRPILYLASMICWPKLYQMSTAMCIDCEGKDPLQNNANAAALLSMREVGSLPRDYTPMQDQRRAASSGRPFATLQQVPVSTSNSLIQQQTCTTVGMNPARMLHFHPKRDRELRKFGKLSLTTDRMHSSSFQMSFSV